MAFEVNGIHYDLAGIEVENERGLEILMRREEQRRQEYAEARITILRRIPVAAIPWTPPPRRSSKRAQRARERHWSR